MVNEGEIVVLGAIVALVGFLLIVAPPFDNIFMFITGLKADKLQDLAIIALFGGITLAIVAGVSSNKKPRY